MSRWFRHYAGMCSDPKFGGIARRAKVSRDRVVFVFAFILETAAEQNDGGSFQFDADAVADLLHCDTDEVERVFDAIAAAGLIEGEKVAKWAARQYEDKTNAERQARYKANKRAGNAPVTEPDCVTNDPIDIDIDRKKDLSSEVPSDPLPKTKSKKGRKEYTPAFTEFWLAYPTDPLMSKQQAFDVWQKLDEADQAVAMLGIPAMAEIKRKDPTYRMLHACRYLSQRRFETLAPANVVPIIPQFSTDEEWFANLRARHAGAK